MKVLKNDFLQKERLIPFTTADAVPFEYTIGKTKYHGIPEKFNPVVDTKRIDCNIKVTTITGKTPTGLELKAECKEYLDFPVTEWVMYIKNVAKKDSRTIKDWKYVNSFEEKNVTLEHGNGDECTEAGYEWYKDKINSRKFEVKPYDTGLSCQGAFPYMRLLFKDCGMNIAIGWSGTWKALFYKKGEKLNMEFSQATFEAYLKPGEAVRTPSVILQCYDGCEDRGRNLWRSWYFAHILPKQNGKMLDPKLVVHTWLIDGLPEFCGVTEENQIRGIKAYEENGIKPDIWWIDAGWYECKNNWPLIGTWKPHPEHFPNGFGKMGEFIENEGIDLLVWFEPERVTENTEIWNEHPDFMLKVKEPADDWQKVNALFDMGNPVARKWITDRVDSIIKDGKIKIYRQDFNYNPWHNWYDNDEEGRIGIKENLHIQGYYAYWDELLERNPGLIMDQCASGGRRNDIEAMKRSVPLHYTDVGYGNHLIKQKQHREMYEWIPYFRAHTMNWDKPDGTYGGSRPVDEFAYQNAIAPAVTSMIEWNDSKEQYEVGVKFHPIWREAAKITLNADYYPLTECKKDPKDFYAMQFDNEKQGFIQIIRNIQVTEDEVKVKPYVAPEDYAKEYTFVDKIGNRFIKMSGKKLAKKGFSDVLAPRSGVIWFYTKR